MVDEIEEKEMGSGRIGFDDEIATLRIAIGVKCCTRMKDQRVQSDQELGVGEMLKSLVNLTL